MNRRSLVLALTAALGLLGSCASSASATLILGPEWEPYTGTIEATNANGHVVLASSLGKVECSSSFKGSIETTGSEVPAEGKLSSLTFSSCTNGNTVAVKKAGSLIFHATTAGDGTVTSTGAEIEVITKTIFGTFTCIYTTSSTDIGTLTSSNTTRGSAMLDVSATVPRTGGSGLCGSTGTWSGSYEITTPWMLTVNDPTRQPAAKIDAVPAGLRNFKEKEQREIIVTERKDGTINWTLEKVDINLVSGSWALQEASNCTNKMVKAGQGEVCKVWVECLEKGWVTFELYLEYGKETEEWTISLTCS